MRGGRAGCGGWAGDGQRGMSPLLLYYSRAYSWVIQKSVSLRYKPSSEWPQTQRAPRQVGRIFVELMTSDCKLKARSEGTAGPKRLDDARCTTYKRRINYRPATCGVDVEVLIRSVCRGGRPIRNERLGQGRVGCFCWRLGPATPIPEVTTSRRGVSHAQTTKHISSTASEHSRTLRCLSSRLGGAGSGDTVSNTPEEFAEA